MKSAVLNYLAAHLGKRELDGLNRLYLLIFRHRVLFWVSVLLNIISAVFEGGSIAMLGMAVAVLTETAEGVSGKIGHFVTTQAELLLGPLDVGYLFLLLVGTAIVLQILRSGLTYASNVTNIHMGTRVRQDASQQAVQHTMSLSYASLGKYPAGEIAAIVEQTNVFRALVSQLNQAILSATLLVAYAAVVLTLTPWGGLVVIAFFAALWISMRNLVARLITFSKHEVRGELDLWRLAVEFLNAPKTVRALNATKLAEEKINAARERQLLFLRKGGIAQAIVNPIFEIILFLCIGFAVSASYYVFRGNLADRMPELFVYIFVLLRVKPQITSLNQVRLKFVRSLIRVGVIEGYLTTEDKTLQRTGGTCINEFRRIISFKGVFFRYPGARDQTLRDISFDIQRHQTVALVGASGSGKTTVIDLLLGLYEPAKGSISVDGHDLNRIDLGGWRDMIGIVEQDVFLLNTSIRNNISFATEDYTTNEIEEAARLAGAHQFIKQSKDGYDTVIGDKGFRLSGGQKQRIALARALVRDPQILLLDEATSALDVESENLINFALNAMHNQRTVILVAHRLSTVMNADLVLVIDKGEIVERGSIDDLLKQDGYFKNYWTMQQVAAK